MISVVFKFIRSLMYPGKVHTSTVSSIENNCSLNFGNNDKLIIHNMPAIVTNLCSIESYGLINNGIYFDLNVVFGNERLKTGDRVIVNAKRENKFCGFIASSVTLDYRNWDSEVIGSDSNQRSICPLLTENFNTEDLKHIEGFVTEWHGTFGILDKKYKFFMADCDFDNKTNFKPNAGDIIVGFLISWNAEERIIKWSPKTVKKIEGNVTFREIDWGIINEDIVFFVNSCCCDFNLVLGQKIWVNIVESKNPPFFNWRAFWLISYGAQKNRLTKLNICESEDLYIGGSFDFGNVTLGKTNSVEVFIKNKCETHIELFDVYFQKSLNQCPFTISSISLKNIEPDSKSTIKISSKASFVGQDNDLLVLEFANFAITREIKINVVDAAQNILNPVAPFVRKNRFNLKAYETTNQKCLIPGQKIFNPKANFEGHLPNYNIPNKLRDAVLTNNERVLQAAPVLLEDLNINNYYTKLSCLLHLEEIQMCFNMDPFAISEASLQRHGEFLTLEVPGLAEGRPSLLLGDKAILWPPNNSSNILYEGYIHEVHQNDIYLKFHQDFQNSYNGETFNITFQFNRSNMRRLHQCLRHVYNSSRCLLFPKYIKLQKPLIKVSDNTNSNEFSEHRKHIVWKNSSLNSQQKLAICHILESCSRPLPYIIFGPPGTGKTITLVECVLQIYEIFENARLLICTPTNSAADLFTQRLLDSNLIGSHELVRLNSYQRNVDSIPEFIKPYCQDKDNILKVIKFPIIICTCSTAGILYSTNMASDHFTHVIIDEACQLTEPEIMIPIGVISTHSNGSLVMAGDHKQLGPVLQSTLAKTYGLGTSYVERIMDQPLYGYNATKFEKYQGYNPQLVTMLIHCYRMHPAILWCPSSLFYNLQLICSVPEERHSLFSNLEILPRKDFPIIFHGIQGSEEREENSPSWFNAAEVVEVTNYLRHLYFNNLNPNDIGIITPYKKQVEKLRLFINAFNIQSCKIGTVEEFQGQERRVIIISTVRSNNNYVSDDIIHNLGFLFNPKRFNVAISRAMELLIVVGNPNLLSQDEYWKAFIRYCRISGGYVGWTPITSE